MESKVHTILPSNKFKPDIWSKKKFKASVFDFTALYICRTNTSYRAREAGQSHVLNRTWMSRSVVPVLEARGSGVAHRFYGRLWLSLQPVRIIERINQSRFYRLDVTKLAFLSWTLLGSVHHFTFILLLVSSVA